VKKQFPFILAILLLVAGCANDAPRIVANPNTEASLSGNLPFDPLQWRVITSEINPAASTMSTLYGNDIAVKYVRSHAELEYPPSSVLALVTWHQKEDDRWFGANIPGKVVSVEFVSVESGPDKKPVISYQHYEGATLQKSAALDDSAAKIRTAYLLTQRAAVMP
jgi:Cytochrome P460